MTRLAALRGRFAGMRVCFLREVGLWSKFKYMFILTNAVDIKSENYNKNVRMIYWYYGRPHACQICSRGGTHSSTARISPVDDQ